jgi:hypothetical protein
LALKAATAMKRKASTVYSVFEMCQTTVRIWGLSARKRIGSDLSAGGPYPVMPVVSDIFLQAVPLQGQGRAGAAPEVVACVIDQLPESRKRPAKGHSGAVSATRSKRGFNGETRRRSAGKSLV